MRSAILTIHSGLAVNSRVPVLAQEGQRSDTTAMFVLFSAGVSAALATIFLDFGLGIPGNAILRAVFPMALGLSLAPRRGGGAVMGLAALGSVLAIKVGGWGSLGFGSLTSLALTGPLLDMALWRARRGWWLYAAFALAGLTSNLVALMVRGGPKLVGVDHVVTQPFVVWSHRAAFTYPLWGLIAGLLSAIVWFRFSSESRNAIDSETTS